MEIYFYILIALCSVIIILLATILFRKPQKSGDSQLINQKIDDFYKNSERGMNLLSSRMQELTDKNYEQQIKLIETLNDNTARQSRAVSDAVLSMQKSNEEKLEAIRNTVDEKLTNTLNSRINMSFKTVSEQLSNVYKSLGEMKELSSNVTATVSGLNRVLSNVKVRGTWAEVQLGAILDQTIPGMYETNVQSNPKYNGRVEFAVRIPNQENGKSIYLPIDSKFPMEDYVRLTVSAEEADAQAVEKARKALENRVTEEAKMIKNYISTPETTPFAIMYLATEGLYAEIAASKSGIAEKIQALGIMIAGPTTITALLNSLAMGFKTIAINEKANEVWKVLGAAKTQYEKFGALLEKARKKVEEAGRVLDEADHRNSIIQKNLKGVETIDAGEAEDVLGIE